MFKERTRTYFFAGGVVLLVLRIVSGVPTTPIFIIGGALLLLSWLARRSRFVYYLGAVFSMMAIAAIVSDPTRWVSSNGALDQCLLAGGVLSWSVGFALFALHPFYSGRWAE